MDTRKRHDYVHDDHQQPRGTTGNGAEMAGQQDAMDASAEAGPSSLRPQASSAQLRDAIRQLTDLQRILVGDNGMSLDEMLAAATSEGTLQGVPEGGLLHALPRLLAPLLPLGRTATQRADVGTTQDLQLGIGPVLTQEQTNLLIARQAAFQPRQYLAMASELVARSQQDFGVARGALDLSEQLKATAGTSNSTPQSLRLKVLDNRKRKREAMQQAGSGMTFAQSAKAQQQLVDSSRSVSRRENGKKGPALSTLRPAFLFAGEQDAKSRGLGVDTNIGGGRPPEESIEAYLDAWHDLLESVDQEASRSVVTDIQSLWDGKRSTNVTIRMGIACLGTAWLNVRFEAINGSSDDSRVWRAAITGLNVRSESEVLGTENNENDKDDGVVSLPLSAFSLYRRLTSELQAKAIDVRSPHERPWHAIAASLFALASLAHLHEREQQSFDTDMMAVQGRATIPRGAMAILDAIGRWAPNSAQIQVQSSMQEAGTMDVGGPESVVAFEDASTSRAPFNEAMPAETNSNNAQAAAPPAVPLDADQEQDEHAAATEPAAVWQPDAPNDQPHLALQENADGSADDELWPDDVATESGADTAAS